MNQIADIIPLMTVRFGLVIGALLLLSGANYGQEECHERFKSGEYKGFTSCSASFLVTLADPFKVREAKGVVLLPGSKAP